MPAPPILVHGHRGARAVQPENSLAAFQYAISIGADFLEMDVAVTRDDVVVVSHDPKLKPAIRKSPRRPTAIRNLTLAELARCTPVPTLDQVLDLAGQGPIQFNIEIKSFPKRPELAPPPERFAELVWQTLQRHKLEPRAMVQSFDFRTLHAMRRLAPEIRLAALYVGPPKSFLAIAREAGTNIVAPHRALVTRARVRAAHAAGVAVVPWTANRPAVWKRLVAAQVDAIITDDPAALIAYLQKLGRH
jgi:glycerophosphoryl diester phosphodiesterase